MRSTANSSSSSSAAKKMMLVDPRFMECCETAIPLAAAAATAAVPTPPYRPVPNVVENSLWELDQEMRGILDDPQASSADEKAQKYQQVLGRYLKRANQWRSGERGERSRPPPSAPFPPAMTTSDEEDKWPTRLEREVIESVPKSMTKKAQRLMDRLKYHPDLTWTDLGEIKYKGSVVPRSNIVDLVNDVLRARQRAPVPIGWKTFAEALKEVNVAQDLIGNRARRKYTHPQESPSDGGDYYSQKWQKY